MAIKFSVSDMFMNEFVNCKRHIILKDMRLNDTTRAAILYDTYFENVHTITYDDTERISEVIDCTHIYGFRIENESYRDDVVRNIAKDIVDKFGISLNSDIILERVIYNNDYSYTNPVNIPVKVVGGRKGKGIEGVIIHGYMVDNKYTGGREERVVVLDKNTGEFFTVNSLSYLEIDNDFLRKYNNAIANYISDKDDDLDNLVKIFINNGYDGGSLYSNKECKKLSDSFATRPFKYCKVFVNDELLNRTEALRISYIDNKNKEHEALREEKLPSIIKWVEENTDKTGEEIINLANHIFEKRNPIKY